MRLPRCVHGWLRILVLLAAPLIASAHVGSPNVFFDGQAGAYPVHVIIKPAEVIPGLAEIFVRLESPNIDRVTALPIKWNAGRKGAPPPDVAAPVRGETNLYRAQLWFMEGGAQSVEVEVTGKAGVGKVMIPVDAIARRVLTMPQGLGTMLALLGCLLMALLLSVIGAAVRESVVEPGKAPTSRRLWGARGAIALAFVIVSLLLWGGKNWWDAEAADYRNNRLYRPLNAVAKVRADDQMPILRLEIEDRNFERSPPLVPDHGKLMHLFLVREPGLDAFAHLHPVKQSRKAFDSALPPLPPGSYRAYADITYETGSSDTLVASVDLPQLTTNGALSGAIRPDEDDSWRIAEPFSPTSSARRCDLQQGCTMTWLEPPTIEVNKPISLKFIVRDADSRPVVPEPYLGMRGHLALRRDDGSVFTHLHPGGTASMAAMQLAVLRTDGKLPLQAAFGKEDPICQIPPATAVEQKWLGGRQSDEGVTFPYAFPKEGAYRLWVQVKVRGEVMTGVFDLTVQGQAARGGALKLTAARSP